MKEVCHNNGKPFFRCTLLLPPVKMLKGDSLDLLVGEIMQIINS
jgi:hypothetical protein